ncbi:MAG: GGDEF domain-containing protein [Paraburkholderia sp.]|nr:GGDEF domain-containing protein [Paraburkholderia sp.]
MRVSLGGVVFLAYLAAASIYHTKAVYETTALVALYVVFGGITYVAATLAPQRSPLRLTLTTISDQALLSALLAVGGQASLPLLWVVFWFLVGAGCRYGQRMLGLSCAVALTGLAGLMAWQPWWHANIMAGLGVALSLAATSIYLAVLVRRLEKQAATDPLTGLSNRVRLEQAIGRTLAIRGPEASQAALLLIDLDGFKEVNDAYGHAVGDELLRSFAAALASNTRRGDTLARLGGDEFVLLAHQIHDKAGALTLATRIHAILNALCTVAGHPVAVSGSIGVCMLTQERDAPELTARTLMRAADSAMYRAKSLGNGKTVFAGTEEMCAVA